MTTVTQHRECDSNHWTVHYKRVKIVLWERHGGCCREGGVTCSCRPPCHRFLRYLEDIRGTRGGGSLNLNDSKQKQWGKSLEKIRADWVRGSKAKNPSVKGPAYQDCENHSKKNLPVLKVLRFEIFARWGPTNDSWISTVSVCCPANAPPQPLVVSQRSRLKSPSQMVQVITYC